MDEKQSTQVAGTQAQTQSGPRPYYRKELLQRQLAALLAQVHGTLIPTRGRPGVTVYAIDGGGEAMVTKQASGTLLVELFKGKCPC